MTSARGRRIQGRRALAIMAWVSLVVVAALLWYARVNRLIRVQAWEPAALLLSAYAMFLSIFAWLLFSPERKSAEESPALFFAGILTLIPPCYIAYLLMPTGSPLRPWLTLGVFLFGILAILSPLPDEVFRIPRDRKSYLRLLTDSYLTELDVEEPRTDFNKLAPRTVMRLTAPPKEETRSETKARDPWTNPFSGTGRTISRTGKQTDHNDAGARDTYVAGAEIPLPPRPPMSGRADNTDTRADRSATAHGPLVPAGPAPIPIGPVLPSIPVSTFGSIPTEVTREKNFERTPVTGFTGPTPVSTSRRPLRDPDATGGKNIGFQTPAVPPMSDPRESVTLSMVSLPVNPPSSISASPPVSLAPPMAAPQPRPLAETTRRPLSEPMAPREVSKPAASPLHELDRRLQAESSDEDSAETDFDVTGAAPGAIAGLTTSMQSIGDFDLERIKDEHGGEMIEGKIVARFEIGQKRAHLHVPFSPPLPGIPEVECEPVGEEPVRLKVAVRQPYGIRIEVRRTEAADPLTAEISFAAVYTPMRRV